MILEWIKSNLASLIAGIAVFLVFTLALFSTLRKKSKAKQGCGSGCSCCPFSDKCH